jgi:protein involved in polysaccharide export with SLBB domain
MRGRMFICWFCFLLVSAYGAEAQTVSQNSGTAPAVASATPLITPVGSSAPDGYKLQNNDLVLITVFQEDDLTTQTRISKNGAISFPLLDSVEIGGLTVPQATEKLKLALDKDYIINPKVTITLLEYAKRRVTVLGQVNTPGSIEMPDEGEMDLLSALAMAGGYTKIADPGKITIRRLVNGKDAVIRVNAKNLASDKETKPFILQPNDTISVAESIF